MCRFPPGSIHQVKRKKLNLTIGVGAASECGVEAEKKECFVVV